MTGLRNEGLDEACRDEAAIPSGSQGTRVVRYRHLRGKPSWLIPSVGEEARAAIPSGRVARLAHWAGVTGARLREVRLRRLHCPREEGRARFRPGIVTMIGKTSRMNGAKAQELVGIGVGTMRPRLGRRPRSTRACPQRLTIEWE